MNDIEIKIAENAGFCFGVNRAVELVEKTLKEESGNVYCWGDLIHNPVMMKRLKSQGLIIIDDLDDLPQEAIFVVRSHGLTIKDLEKVKTKTSKIINTTCPFVKKAHLTAENFKNQGFQVLIFGDKDHVEVKGINSRAENRALVVASVSDLKKNKGKIEKKLGIVCQTTQKKEKLKEILEYLEKNKIDFELQDTICSDTTKKQTEIKNSPPGLDLLIVVGGLHSSNTTKLAELSRARGIKTHHIEDSSKVSINWFAGNEKVTLTAGASTPVDEVIATKKAIESFSF